MSHAKKLFEALVREHAVVMQRYFREQAIEKLAETLQLSVAAVKKRLQRARALVWDCMERKLAPLN